MQFGLRLIFFFTVRLRLVRHLECEYHKMMSHPFSCQGHMMLTRRIAGDIGLDHLVNVVTAKFLHCKATLFLYGINKPLCGGNQEPHFILFSIKQDQNFSFSSFACLLNLISVQLMG